MEKYTETSENQDIYRAYMISYQKHWLDLIIACDN